MQSFWWWPTTPSSPSTSWQLSSTTGALGSLLHEHGHGHPHHPLQEGLQHIVLSGPQLVILPQLYYTPLLVLSSLLEKEPTVLDSSIPSQWEEGGQHHHQQEGWLQHPVPVLLQLDGEAGQVYASSSKFYQASKEKSFIPNFQNLSNHLYLIVCNSNCDSVSNCRPWRLVLPWNIM